MVPCPWAREAAAQYRGEDVGVHLTLNAEYEPLPLGPDHPRAVACSTATAGSRARSSDVWDHADLDEVRASAGPRSSGRSSGASTSATSTPTWARCSCAPSSSTSTSSWRSSSACRCAWPARATERLIGFPFRRLAAEEGVVFPDHFVYTHVGSTRTIERTLFDLRPGVTEMYLHPAVDTAELRASHPDWAQPGRRPRVRDAPIASLRDLVERAGAILIGYRELRELQRAQPCHGVTTHARGTRPSCARAALPAGAAHRRRARRTSASGRGDEIIGDDDGAIAFTFKQSAAPVAAWLVLVAVHPDTAGRGRRQALSAPRSTSRRHASTATAHLASAVPRYVWPGVDVDEHACRHVVRDARLRA